MNLAIAWLLMASGSSAGCAVEVPADDPVAAGLLFSLAGYEHLRSPDPEAAERAVDCLTEARTRLPDSAVVAEDLATALVRLQRWPEADLALASARALGAAGAHVELLTAVIAAARGDFGRARSAASKEGTWRGDLIATRYGSSAAKDRLLALLPESTRRAAWGRLVLAMTESEDGDVPAARQLVGSAQDVADQLGLSTIAVASRALDARLLSDAAGWQGRLRLRSAIEYASNPGFASARDAPGGAPFRLALGASGGLSRSFGRLIAYGAARIDQHVFLSQRDELATLDIFRWSVSVGLRYPISADPNGTVLAVVTRFTDVFGDRFGQHLGWSLEGGPELHVRVAGNLRARLAFYGQKNVYIDSSPPPGLLSAVDRDRVGQRAVLSFRYRTRLLDAVGDAMFIRDRAKGEAFDANGGGVGFRVAIQATDRMSLRAGLTGTLREFGPVGDAAIIGDAATRTEFRAVARLGVRWAVDDRLFLVAENVWIGTAARDEHRYSNNVLSTGLEAVW